MLLGVVSVAFLTLAGCNGGDDDSNGAATPLPTSTATSVPTNTTAPPADTPTPTLAPTDVPTIPPTATPTATSVPTPVNPTVEGPITSPGSPVIQSTSFPLADVGYRQAEFFISGEAIAYANDGELGPDGDWLAVPAGTSAAYKTRIIVYRPIDEADFNGTLVVEWLNVSGGLDAAPDWTSMHTELTRSGYAWMGVSAQFVGVEGGQSPIPGLNLSLKGANPARYGSLHHPGDSFSYDIFTQAGRAARNPDGVDPLDGLVPDRIIAVGESQSAFRLVTYVNAIHPLAEFYDAFLLHSRGGGSAPLSQSPQERIDTSPVVRIRDDLEVPVLTFQTETDLPTEGGLGYLPSRQPDGPLFRLWEVAGTSHADTYTLLVGFNDKGDDPTALRILVDVDKPIPGIIECDSPINSGPQHVVLKAAIAALNRWVRDGEAPAEAPRLETSGDPPVFVLDDLGNVQGGIRTSWVEAPVARLSGLGQSGGSFCRIFGTTIAFDDETLATLYPDRASYVSAVGEATDAAVAAGFLLPADAELIDAAATTQDIGAGGGVPNPTIEGPVTGGLGVPFLGTTMFDLSQVGYRETEYFASGTATAYTSDRELLPDGLWDVSRGETAEYKTRVLVYRPIDPVDFNGTVIVEWLNVSGGVDAGPDWIMSHVELIREGYAWVGVSAQYVGVEGGDPILPGLPSMPLKEFDPERYGSLVHPGDSFSYDIFSQVAQAIRQPGDLNLLEGLNIEAIIAAGESQSAFRMVTYINAFHPAFHLFDGYLVHSRAGFAAPLSETPQTPIGPMGAVFIRNDIDVPVFNFQTETDVLGILQSYPSRQPDSDFFRLWEVAGTSHADTYTTVLGFDDLGDDPDVVNLVLTTMPLGTIGEVETDIECGVPINSGPQHFVLKAAIAALNDWVRRGTPPPTAPLLEVDPGPPAVLVRDANGNALGGVRSPQVDVPIATLSGEGQVGSLFCILFGSTAPFDDALLASLYPDHDTYVAAIDEAADLAVERGFLLAPDAELIKTNARESDIGG